MKKICVIIRVFNRVEDLKFCVDIIRDTWIINTYYIIVVSNGTKKGFVINEGIKNKIDCFVELEDNAGHLSGNTQLLINGLPFIPSECLFTIILEADTWIYSDDLIEKYYKKQVLNDVVWISAQWYNGTTSLSTDFAIIQTEFLLNNPEIFNFSKYPELYVPEYLLRKNLKFLYIDEIQPINLPSYIKHYPFARLGRFFAFPKGKMITHHLEFLKEGIKEKKVIFNKISKSNYFNLINEKKITFNQNQMKFFILLSYIFPRKGWFRKEKLENLSGHIKYN